MGLLYPPSGSGPKASKNIIGSPNFYDEIQFINLLVLKKRYPPWGPLQGANKLMSNQNSQSSNSINYWLTLLKICYHTMKFWELSLFA